MTPPPTTRTHLLAQRKFAQWQTRLAGFKLPFYLGVFCRPLATAENAAPLVGAIAFLALVAMAFLAFRKGHPAVASRSRGQSLGRMGASLLSAFFVLRIGQSFWAPASTDTFQADSDALLAATALALLLVGMQCFASHFRYISWFLVIQTAVCGTLVLLPIEHSILLGNSGYDLQILLPGACLGLWNLVQGTARTPWVDLLAVITTGAFAATQPVVGGALVLAAFLIFASLLPKSPRAPRLGRQLSWFGAGILLLALSFSMGGTQVNPVDAAPEAAAVAETSGQGELGGASVRTLIWGTIPSLLGDYPAGVGTGQFAATYPPYRDQREIDLTSHNHQLAEVFEVEHPHNDLVFAFAEQGYLGGLLFSLGWLAVGASLLMMVLRKDGRTLTSDSHDLHRRGLGFATLALLSVSLFHSSLLSNPIAGPLGLFLIGLATPTAWGRPPGFGGHSKLRAALLLAVAALLALQGPAALSLHSHEHAFWSRGQIASRSMEEALLARPDSFQANAQAARIAEARGESVGHDFQSQVEASWRAALAIRPHSIEALTNLGGLLAARGDFAGALELWSHARELDSGYPVIQRNLQRLGADLVLTGELAQGLPELAPDLAAKVSAAPSDLPIDVGSYLFDAAATEPDALRKRALTCAAQWTWARESAAAGKWAEAIRLYRQARREAAKLPARTNAPLGFEYAGALSRDGRRGEAIVLWSTLEDASEGYADSPAWASAAYSQR